MIVPPILSPFGRCRPVSVHRPGPFGSTLVHLESLSSRLLLLQQSTPTSLSRLVLREAELVSRRSRSVASVALYSPLQEVVGQLALHLPS